MYPERAYLFHQHHFLVNTTVLRTETQKVHFCIMALLWICATPIKQKDPYDKLLDSFPEATTQLRRIHVSEIAAVVAPTSRLDGTCNIVGLAN